jgi:hypothetical protein
MAIVHMEPWWFRLPGPIIIAVDFLLFSTKYLEIKCVKHGPNS